MDKLPDTHKARWFAGAALNSPEQVMSSVMSTALSRLNAFLDSELEQLLCFDTVIDAEKFCNEKSALFIIMPEENPNTFFLISLIIQQLYREILAVADENGGKLKNRCVFFCDEFGTLPKIDSAEMMFSASRSRRLQIVPIIQSFAQLEKNYGKEGAEIIIDNTQITISGGFAALYARKIICHFTLSVADVHDFCTSNSLLLFLQLLRSQTLQAAELSRPLTR